jgi:hypothetical protein
MKKSVVPEVATHRWLIQTYGIIDAMRTVTLNV